MTVKLVMDGTPDRLGLVEENRQRQRQRQKQILRQTTPASKKPLAGDPGAAKGDN
jgi:putative protein kinase ArgK-like GTPase of G3E family